MLKPLGKRVLLKLEEEAPNTVSGIIAVRDMSNVKTGMVIEIGQEVKEVFRGERVLISKGIGIETKEGLVVGVVDILAVVSDG